MARLAGPEPGAAGSGRSGEAGGAGGRVRRCFTWEGKGRGPAAPLRPQGLRPGGDWAVHERPEPLRQSALVSRLPCVRGRARKHLHEFPVAELLGRVLPEDLLVGVGEGVGVVCPALELLRVFVGVGELEKLLGDVMAEPFANSPTRPQQLQNLFRATQSGRWTSAPRRPAQSLLHASKAALIAPSRSSAAFATRLTSASASNASSCRASFLAAAWESFCPGAASSAAAGASPAAGASSAPSASFSSISLRAARPR